MKNSRLKIKSKIDDPEAQLAAMYYNFGKSLRMNPEQVGRMGCRMVGLLGALMDTEGED